MAVLALKPLSGATLPILSDSGERYGVLVACSRHRWADSAAFEALKRLARVLAARHGALKPGRVVIPEFRQELYWERLRDHAVGIDVYRSSDCRIPWRYRALSDTKGLLTLGLSDDGVLHGLLAGRGKIDSADMMRQMISFDHGVPSFAAAIDFTSESISYAAQGFTPPISLAASGPVGALHDAGGVTAGTATLPSPMEAAIFDTELWRWLDGRNKIERLRPLLEKETPSGLASIVRLGSSQP
jgi:hypothetical protein